MEKEIQVDNINLDDIHYEINGNIKESGSILKKLTCLRPAHKSGIPKIYAEFKENKLISHNYGHSGTGYCYLFSTVETAIENFQKLRLENGISRTDKITVIGLGCIGLVTALTLFTRGYKNIEIIGENFESTPSQLAGGLFEISLTANYSKEQKEIMNEHFKHTYFEYKNIIEGQHPFIKYGVVEIDFYSDFYEENVGLSYLANLGLVQKPEKVILKIKKTDNRFNMTHFRTYHIITTLFMANLMKVVEIWKIPLVRKKIQNFNEINSNIIFNCTGLGAYELNDDKDVFPICGHAFVLKNQETSKSNYILRFAKIQGLENQSYNGSLYYMPKTSGFIGGSFVKGYFGDDDVTNQEYYDNLMKRINYVFKGIKPKF